MKKLACAVLVYPLDKEIIQTLHVPLLSSIVIAWTFFLVPLSLTIEAKEAWDRPMTVRLPKFTTQSRVLNLPAETRSTTIT
jgi:hypothetical protein